MKYLRVIRAFRYMLSPRWKHMSHSLDQVSKCIDRAIAQPESSDWHIMWAQSWLQDAEYEWRCLQDIRDGKE